ncbi:hypothetical protein PybrP1_007590 [[Pythium] brassicae (nom. inval.)]|nr:hypothetical protein PybrP1_007590 [[Pythium] brassicae (nom. inval.)]
MARADAKKTPVADRLRATEDALNAAQATIARQEEREKQLRALLVTNGVALEATQQGAHPLVDARLQALKSVHEQKVRALMKSINQLQEQLQALRAQDKEHRRSALIQGLRQSLREQELVADVLKQTLAEKLPEFRASRALVNAFVAQKCVGGPLRFRPKTREELESELEQLDTKYRKALGSLRVSATEREQRGAQAKDRDSEAKCRETRGGRAEDDALMLGEEESGDLCVPPPALQEEVERLRIELSSKAVTIHAQADEVALLYAEIDTLRVVHDKLERKKRRVALLEDKLASQQLETVRLVHASEGMAHTCAQLEEELQFLRDTHVDDVASRDADRLAQLELTERLRARELELQQQLEAQQRKWAADRSAILQQLRLLEKEKQLAEDETTRSDAERAALGKRNDALERQKTALQEQLDHADAATRSLAARVEELEGVLMQRESFSREELAALATSAAAQVRELQQRVAEKDTAAKNAERQLNAAKLLVRQGRKEKEQLQERVAALQAECATAMMAFGDDAESEQQLHERLLDSDSEGARGRHLPESDAMTLSDDDDDDQYELVSERETLVFDRAFVDARQQFDSRGGGGESFFRAYLLNKIQPGSVKGSMFTMTVAIVGAGVLALPYAVEQAGLALGVLLITGGALVTNFSLRLLLACAELAQARSYMDLARGTGGPRLAGFTQFVVCLNLFGTSVGYLVGSAELIQLAMTAFLGPSSHSIFVDRQALLLLLCAVFVLPLALFRSLESLRFSSLFSILCIVFMALVIVVKYFQFVHWGLAPDIAYQLTHLTLFDWRLTRLLAAFPLVIFAYTCHPNVLPIYLVLQRRSSRRMYKVMNRSVGLAAAVYALCGAFVVLTFGEHTKSNFLKNDYRGDGAVLAGCVGFSVALILTVPLFVHTLRDNIREALLANRRLNAFSHALLSTTLVLAALFVALGSGDIASVLGVLGATTNPVICFVLPAFFIHRLGSAARHRVQKISALMLALATSVLSLLSLLQQLGLLW